MISNKGIKGAHTHTACVLPLFSIAHDVNIQLVQLLSYCFAFFLAFFAELNQKIPSLFHALNKWNFIFMTPTASD